ncbi:AraC family transcriptional regulator [Flavobacteriaceae bacterium S356]|uniref:AraC family transcriptional regulator n=1 Tax=Asprobacillus argus TaxID=3076534 RepID=A0ABU3LF66_9FLAO|nr:AraC family transcriptional regulator [Flavobacteriaceae bacterium S356]
MKAKLIEEIAQQGDVNQIYLDELNIWMVLFFSIGVIGVFFSLMINMRKKREVHSCLMIGSYILLYSFFSICLSLHMFDVDVDTVNGLLLITTLTFLNEPLLYLYFKRVSEKRPLKPRDLCHGLPLVLFLIGWFFYRVTFLDAMYYKQALLMVYTLFIYRVYKKKVDTKRKSERDLISWLQNILRIYLVFLAVYAITILSWLKAIPQFFTMYPLLFSTNLMILYMAYTAYIKPDIFSRSYLFKEGVFFKYKKSGLTDGYSEELRNRLQVLFERDKIYRNSGLSLENLSEELETTRHNVSQVINEHFEMNFFQFVNKYRIKEAVHMFEESNYKDLKIINIAYDVGFNNKVTFNKAFKAEMSMTPTLFIEQMRHKQSKNGKKKVTSYRES